MNTQTSAEILRNYRVHFKPYVYSKVVKAKLFIDLNYTRQLDLDQIAGVAHFSKYHFIRVFHRIYGITPKQYLVKLRIEKAKGCLAKGLDTGSVCRIVGYESHSSFESLFKQRTDVTPASFRKTCLNQKEEMEEKPVRFIPHCFTKL